MTLNTRKALRNKLENGENMTFQDALNFFFLPEDQDEVARSFGYADAEQMAYYENQSEEVPPMTDNEVEQLVERESSVAVAEGTVQYLAPPPSEILVLMRQDPREVYGEDTIAFQTLDTELSGVY